MAAVENDGYMRAAFSHFRDEQREFLVSQIPRAGLATVVADQRLVEPVGLNMPELRGRLLLRAMAAVVEERDIAGLGLPKMLAEPVDNRLAFGLTVSEYLRMKHVPCRLGARGEQRLEADDVVHAAPQRPHGSFVGVDANEQCVDGSCHWWVRLVVSEEKVCSWLFAQSRKVVSPG